MEYVLNFGKHRGLRLAEIPQSYVRWLVENEVYKKYSDLESALVAFGALGNNLPSASIAGIQSWQVRKRRVDDMRSPDSRHEPDKNSVVTHFAGTESPSIPARTLVRTQDWNAVLEKELQRGESMAVIATAGSGKTTLLMEYASRRRNKRFLYIVFNKGVQESKEQEFAALGLSNVEAKTFHSIAYRITSHIHGGKKIATNLSFPPSGSSSSDSRRIALDVRKTLERFMASSDAAIEAHHIPPKPRPAGADSNILAAARDLWEQLSRPGSPEGITHDGYLKCLQLQPALQEKAFRGYDCVMLDEAHDCSDAQLDVFRAVPAAKVIVLDPHQCIYQFRGASPESLDAVRATHTLPLRRTFRFGEPLAGCAAAMVRFFKRPRHQDFAIEGRPDRPTAVHPLADGEEGGLYARLAQRGEPLLVLARQNRTLFEEVLRCLRCPAVARIAFVGGLGGACGGLDRILNLHRQHRGGRSLASLRAACEADGDDGLGSMCAVVERYGADLPARIAEIRARCVDQAADPQVLFSTVHKAKGLGWPSVYLAGDFLGRGRSLGECLEEAAEGGGALAALAALGLPPPLAPVVTAAHREEVRAAVGDEETNVAYVALTRAEARVFVHCRTAEWLRFAGALPGPGPPPSPASATSTPASAAATASESPAAGAATSTPGAPISPA